MRILRNILRGTAIEYALVATLIAVAAIVAFRKPRHLDQHDVQQRR